MLVLGSRFSRVYLLQRASCTSPYIDILNKIHASCMCRPFEVRLPHREKLLTVGSHWPEIDRARRMVAKTAPQHSTSCPRDQARRCCTHAQHWLRPRMPPRTRSSTARRTRRGRRARWRRFGAAPARQQAQCGRLSGRQAHWGGRGACIGIVTPLTATVHNGRPQ